jgi:hypothetical protein
VTSYEWTSPTEDVQWLSDIRRRQNAAEAGSSAGLAAGQSFVTPSRRDVDNAEPWYTNPRLFPWLANGWGLLDLAAWLIYVWNGNFVFAVVMSAVGAGFLLRLSFCADGRLLHRQISKLVRQPLSLDARRDVAVGVSSHHGRCDRAGSATRQRSGPLRVAGERCWVIWTLRNLSGGGSDTLARVSNPHLATKNCCVS